jgi:hypothetical protein
MVLPNPTIVPQAQGRSTLNMESISSKEFQTFVGWNNQPTKLLSIKRG